MCWVEFGYTSPGLSGQSAIRYNSRRLNGQVSNRERLGHWGATKFFRAQFRWDSTHKVKSRVARHRLWPVIKVSPSIHAVSGRARAICPCRWAAANSERQAIPAAARKTIRTPEGFRGPNSADSCPARAVADQGPALNRSNPEFLQCNAAARENDLGKGGAHPSNGRAAGGAWPDRSKPSGHIRSELCRHTACKVPRLENLRRFRRRFA